MVSFAIEGADLHNNVRTAIAFSCPLSTLVLRIRPAQVTFKSGVQCKSLGKHPRKKTHKWTMKPKTRSFINLCRKALKRWCKSLVSLGGLNRYQEKAGGAQLLHTPGLAWVPTGLMFIPCPPLRVQLSMPRPVRTLRLRSPNFLPTSWTRSSWLSSATCSSWWQSVPWQPWSLG